MTRAERMEAALRAIEDMSIARMEAIAERKLPEDITDASAIVEFIRDVARRALEAE